MGQTPYLMPSHKVREKGKPDMAYAYFLDALPSKLDEISHDTVVVGEISAGNRAAWTQDGRILGMSCALNDHAAGRNLWPLIADLIPASIDDSNRLQVAQNILNAVLLYPGEFLAPSEGKPTSAGGYSLWMQDFEFAPSESVNADEVYAGVIATLWAGKQILGDDVSIVPVPSSSLFKNLGNPDIGSILASDGLLAALRLENLPLTNTQSGSDGQWNFLSVLHHNGLIDGFLGQQYSANNPDALPGSISSDTRDFYGQDSLPYALLSSISQLDSTHIDGPAWQSHFDGDLPFEAGVYFPGVIPEGFEPAAFLQPRQDGVISTAISTVQEESGLPILDLSVLSSDQKLVVDVQMSREADFESEVGFYIIQNTDGAVYDPDTGTNILPGDPRYAEMALNAANQFAPLQALSAEDDSFDSRLENIYGGQLLAPVVRVLQPSPYGGYNAPPEIVTYFAYAKANDDGFAHFKELAPNRFGMEDMQYGGDQDFNDLIMDFSFYMG